MNELLSRYRRLAAVPRALLSLAFGTSTALLSVQASANCAMPTTYEVTVRANTVTICPMNYQNRGCPDPGGMLREGGGKVVKIADTCVDGSRPERCYVDECVPAGDYKYGFATPYECCKTCCGTDYYAMATVEQDPSTPCVPGGNGGEGTEGVPWGDSSSICDYQGGGAVGGTGGAAGEADGPRSSGDEGCSCRTGARFDPRMFVLAANGALVLLGFLLTRRRRRT